MSGALGLAGLALPEEYGGVGCGPAELALACEETGRALAPSPLFATSALAAPLLLALGTPEQRAAHLPPLADGGLTCALAVPGGSLALALGLTGDNTADGWSGGGRAGGVQAHAVDGGWRLYGEAAQVVDGHSAGLLLVAAHAGGFARSRTLLFLVRTAPSEAAGLVRARQATLDPTRTQALVQFRDTEAELLGEEPADVLGALAATGRAAAVMLAAEAVGAARAALDRIIEHVGSREQFGRPVGSFQAVKHRLADLFVQVEAAHSLTYCAARNPAPDRRAARSPWPTRWRRSTPRPASASSSTAASDSPGNTRRTSSSSGPPPTNCSSGPCDGCAHGRRNGPDSSERWRRRCPSDADSCRRCPRPGPSPGSAPVSCPRWTRRCTG